MSRLPQTLLGLRRDIDLWAAELGFDAVGVSDTDLSCHEPHLKRWLAAGHHAKMQYMSRHGMKRARPQELVPGTLRIISVRMNYWPESDHETSVALDDPEYAYVSRYALGRDYHKLMRKRLQNLADRITDKVGEFGYRAFVDSAPVLEKALANRAGLGWIGKHSNLLYPQVGSYFFLGELFTDLPLKVDPPYTQEHCGRCRKCLDFCPTQAIVAPYQVDARRCISYLTIENPGSIPIEFRDAIGNRIYGCDDCQLVCPWNRFARKTKLPDFLAKNGLDKPKLLELFLWTEKEFLTKFQGSPIRRIGYVAFLRNIAVALGNGSASEAVLSALRSRANHKSAIVREHSHWALQKLLSH